MFIKSMCLSAVLIAFPCLAFASAVSEVQSKMKTPPRYVSGPPRPAHLPAFKRGTVTRGEPVQIFKDKKFPDIPLSSPSVKPAH